MNIGSLPSAVLLFMGIFLYGRRCNWRKLKETKGYFIKFVVVIVLGVLFKKLFEFLHSTDISPDITDTLEVIIAILVGAVWGWEHKRTSNSSLKSKV